jgi:hypothetical protein
VGLAEIFRIEISSIHCAKIADSADTREFKLRNKLPSHIVVRDQRNRMTQRHSELIENKSLISVTHEGERERESKAENAELSLILLPSLSELMTAAVFFFADVCPFH